MMRRIGYAAVALLCACNPHPPAQSARAVPGAAAARALQASPSPSGLPPITVQSRGSAHQPVRIVEQLGNRKLYELTARSTQSKLASQNEFRATFSVTHVIFYNDAGGTLAGDAPLTTIDKATQRVVMQGGVRAHTSEGISLQCDRLEYDRSNGQLHGTGNVRINSTQGYALTGGSFHSDLRLTNVHME